MTSLNMKKAILLSGVAAIVLSTSLASGRVHGQAYKAAASIPTADKLADGEDANFHQMPQRTWSHIVDTQYRGTSVEVHPKATGAILQLQRRLASILVKQDFLPPDRLGHFQWVKTLGGTITGWRVKITKVADVEGTIMVQVMVNAVQSSGASVSHSNVYEYYAFDGEQLHYVQSEADSVSPKVVTFN